MTSDGVLFLDKLSVISCRLGGGYQGRWRKYSIIPNIEGQKYTLGDCYISRGEQGELILLPQDTELEELGDSVCEINVHQHRFWISPLGTSLIYVNGVRVEEKRGLNFGDRLSFREEDNNLRCLFLFMKREFEVEPPATYGRSAAVPITRETECGFEVDTGPLGIAEILSHVLAYLPTRDVKNARIVSKLWNEEGSRMLKKRCIVDLSYQHHGFNYSESLMFFRYAHEMKNNLFPNWRIRLPNFRYRGAQFEFEGVWNTWMPAAKYTEDIECFLQKEHNVKTLHLCGSILSTFDEELRIKILTKVQHTLQDLKLSFPYDKDAEKENHSSHSIRFKNLQKLTLSSRYAKKMTWWQTLIPAIQGIKALCFYFDVVNAGDLVFLKELESLPNLEEVSLSRTTSELLEWLQKVKKPLKKLELNDLNDFNEDDFNGFEQLLLKHSNTLENIKFTLPGRSNSLRINLPVFPNLKIWNVFVSNNGSGGDKFGPISLVFHGGDVSIIYHRHLPNLQSLKVWLFANRDPNIKKIWEDFSIFFEQFFPVCEEGQAQQICRTLLSLDIPYKEDPEYKPRHIFRRAGEIATMFPNVFNEWTNEVRKRRGRKQIPPSTRVLRSMSGAQH